MLKPNFLLFVGNSNPSLYDEILSVIFSWWFFLILLVFLFVNLYTYRKSITTWLSLIWSNYNISRKINGLKKLKNKQQIIIDNLEKTKTYFHQKLNESGGVGDDILKLVKNNIKLWQDQQDFHLKIKIFIQDRIIALSNQQEEIILLHSLIKSIEKVPSSSKHVQQLKGKMKSLIVKSAENTIRSWKNRIETASREADLEKAYLEIYKQYGITRNGFA